MYLSITMYTSGLFPSFLLTDKFCLVVWPEENYVSILCLERVIEGNKVGDKCRVKVQKKIHEGKFVAIGKLLFTFSVFKYLNTGRLNA